MVQCGGGLSGESGGRRAAAAGCPRAKLVGVKVEGNEHIAAKNNGYPVPYETCLYFTNLLYVFINEGWMVGHTRHRAV